MNTKIIHSKTLDSLRAANLFISLMDIVDVSGFWSPMLKPELSFSAISKQQDDISEQLNLISIVVDEVIAKRGAALKGKELLRESIGRFLIYSPLHATMDALANGETSGFFDEADAPPWESWLGFVSFIDIHSQQYEGYLIAWIPDDFVLVAQAGIDVCLGKSLFWADDLEEAHTYGEVAVALCNEISIVKMVYCPSSK